jgi:diacylglycerol kinase (ATP)
MRRPRARLIYNPSAGKELMRTHLPDVLDTLDAGGLEVSCTMTHGPYDAVRAAKQAVEEECEYVIAAGGDGTINEVVNGISGCSYRPTLGIIPAGTTNDLARALNLPREPREIARVIAERHTMPLDVGQAGDHYFINIAACGILTEITYEVQSKLKTYLGQLAYYVKGLEKLPHMHPIHLEIEADGFSFDDQVSILLIANSNSVGGFEKMAADASLHDGLFNVIMLKACTLPELIKIAAQARFGSHLTNEKVVTFKTDRLSVRSRDTVELNLDGEYGGRLPTTFTCLKHHLNVIVGK